MLNVARQERQKGQRHLLAAFAEIVRTRPAVHLVTAGREGSATTELTAERERLGSASPEPLRFSYRYCRKLAAFARVCVA